jgi:hypothetical protein
MKLRYLQLPVACLLIAVTRPAFSQITPETSTPVKATTASVPAAFVYVASTTGKIYEFSAASSGKLTAISGSPISATSGLMAVNGKYLFAPNGGNIDSYALASNGALKKVATINAAGYDAGGDYGATAFSVGMDHTGSTLYSSIYDINDDPFESFRVTTSNGQLIYTGQQATSRYSASYPLTFTGNNKFAYEALDWIEDTGIFGFQRNNDGSLTSLSQSEAWPVARPNDCFYTDFAVADTTNHLAVAVHAVNECPFGNNDGNSQIATYTVDSQGNLSTSSTYSNMLVTPFTYVIWMTMAPSGKVLAVAGGAGMQLYHYNGASPVTKFTGMVATHQIDQMYFDNTNHLYALSKVDQKVYVYTLGNSGTTYIGSYSVPSAAYIIVQPK